MSYFGEEIRCALTEIGFIERYEEISKKYNRERANSFSEILEIKKEECIKLFREMGYSAKYYAKEKIYKIKYEKIDDLTFGIHLSVGAIIGEVEPIWVVEDGAEMLLGEPWFDYSRRMIDVDYKIQYPIFATLDDLKDILNYTFKMYEDFKDA